MKKLNLKKILLPAVSLFIICFITTLLLCSTHMLTKNAIENQEIQSSESAKKIVLPQAESFKQSLSKDESFAYFVGMDAGGNTVGYVFKTEAKGYGGTVEIMTGITTDATIENVAILSHNETPGLGANVENESFLEQFKADVSSGTFTITKKVPQNDHEIEAVTGATISSKAVTNAVNEAVRSFKQIIQKERSR